MSAPGDAAAPPEDEYPPEVWPRLYGAVLGLLTLDIALFLAITRWFS